MSTSREDRWLSWAKRIHASAGTGIHFADSDYDRERFEEINALAGEMLAELASSTPEAIEELIVDHGKGYATPKIDVRGAVFSDDGDGILLVKEKSDQRWCLPGGYAEVGLTPSANVEKEIIEEAGLTVRATKLFALRHKAAHAFRPDVRDFYKFYFLCKQTAPGLPTPGLETAGADYFRLDDLPPLSEGRTIRLDLEQAFEHRDHPMRPCDAD